MKLDITEAYGAFISGSSPERPTRFSIVMTDRERTVIYTITSLYIGGDDVKENGLSVSRLLRLKQRLVGYYSDLERAKECVQHDWGSFSEAGYFTHIVIERVVEGLYNIAGFDLDNQSEWWYSFNTELRKWVPCKKPDFLAGCVGFGLG